MSYFVRFTGFVAMENKVFLLYLRSNKEFDIENDILA